MPTAPPDLFPDAGLAIAPLYDEPFMIAVPKKHPLAKRKKISSEELKKETMLLLGTVLSLAFTAPGGSLPASSGGIAGLLGAKAIRSATARAKAAKHERKHALHAARDTLVITGADRLRDDRIDRTEQAQAEYTGVEKVEVAQCDGRDRGTTKLADHERVHDAHGLNTQIDEHDRHGDARHVPQIAPPVPARLDREAQRPVARFAEDTSSRTSRSSRGASYGMPSLIVHATPPPGPAAASARGG